MGQWPVSPMDICLRIMELLNGRAARCGSARVVELVAAWVWWALLFKVAPFRSAKRCTVARAPGQDPPLGLSSCTLCCQSNNTRRRCNRCLLPSYLTQLPPRPCHSFASSISTSGPTTCDDRRRRRLRPPAVYRSRYRHACPTRLSTALPFARGLLPPAHPRPSPPEQTHTNIPLCILNSTATTSSHPATRATSSLILDSLHRILRRAYTYIYIPPIPHIGGFE